jgi:hypothetical protein
MATSRDKMRASIFKDENKRPASSVITLFGEQVEIRQPTLAIINKIGRLTVDPKIPGIVRVLIEYCYIPGTDEKVFDQADAEQLASMPTGQWLHDFNREVEKLTGVDVKVAEKNSEETA